MNLHEMQRIRKNEKAVNLAKETLCKCESEGFSIADIKDFAYTLQSMIDKILILNEERHRFNFLLLADESFRSSNADTHQQNFENHLHQQV